MTSSVTNTTFVLRPIILYTGESGFGVTSASIAVPSGGATATQVRLQDPWFFFPVFIGVLVWGGLFFRDERLRALIPLRSQPTSTAAE